MRLKVSELAQRAGVSADTVRYYEKEGLLAEPARTHSGYRQYEQTAVERLHFIRGAQTLGLKLGDIKELLAIRDRGACPRGHTQRLLEQRVTEIDAEIRRLGASSANFSRWSASSARPNLLLLRGLARSSL